MSLNKNNTLDLVDINIDHEYDNLRNTISNNQKRNHEKIFQKKIQLIEQNNSNSIQWKHHSKKNNINSDYSESPNLLNIKEKSQIFLSSPIKKTNSINMNNEKEQNENNEKNKVESLKSENNCNSSLVASSNKKNDLIEDRDFTLKKTIESEYKLNYLKGNLQNEEDSKNSNKKIRKRKNSNIDIEKVQTSQIKSPFRTNIEKKNSDVFQENLNLKFEQISLDEEVKINLKNENNSENSNDYNKNNEFVLIGLDSNIPDKKNFNRISSAKTDLKTEFMQERKTYFNNEKGRLTAANPLLRIKSDLMAFKDVKVQNIILSDDEWIDMITKNKVDESLREKMIISLKYGINKNLRGKIWVLLSDSIKQALKYNNNTFYEFLDLTNEELESRIEKDIDRTIVTKIDKDSKTVRRSNFLDYKDKKKNLFNILKVYGLFDKDVSYCQGTNYIVALLLYNLDSERLVFWVFHQLMNKFFWRYIYLNKTPKLFRLMESLKSSIKSQLTELHTHFDKCNFYDMFDGLFSPFFITLFTYNIPLEYSCRILDLFWIYQENIIIDCIVHLLKLSSVKLLRMNDEEMMTYIRQDMTKECLLKFGIQSCLPFKFS